MLELVMDLLEKYPQIKLFENRLWQEGVKVYDPEAGRKELWLSAVVFLPEKERLLVMEKVRGMIKTESMGWQEPGCLHLTFQGSKFDGSNMADLERASVDLLPELARLATRMRVLKGDFWYPFVGQTGVYGIFDSEVDGEILRLREEVAKFVGRWPMPQSQLPEFRGFTHVFLGRWSGVPTDDEMEKWKKLEVVKMPMEISDMAFCWADKFQTPGSRKMVAEYQLKQR